jgi:hypothetical protein
MFIFFFGGHRQSHENSITRKTLVDVICNGGNVVIGLHWVLVKRHWERGVKRGGFL